MELVVFSNDFFFLPWPLLKFSHSEQYSATLPIGGAISYISFNFAS